MYFFKENWRQIFVNWPIINIVFLIKNSNNNNNGNNDDNINNSNKNINTRLAVIETILFKINSVLRNIWVLLIEYLKLIFRPAAADHRQRTLYHKVTRPNKHLKFYLST